MRQRRRSPLLEGRRSRTSRSPRGGGARPRRPLSPVRGDRVTDIPTPLRQRAKPEGSASPRGGCLPRSSGGCLWGSLVCGVGLPAGGPRVQRDRHRLGLHGGDRLHPALVAGCGATRQALRTADAHPHRLHHHPGRNPGPALPGAGFIECPGVPARALPDRCRHRVMQTPSVNIVQSSFPDEKQGEISLHSRSISNLGSSLGPPLLGRFWCQGSRRETGRMPSRC